MSNQDNMVDRVKAAIIKAVFEGKDDELVGDIPEKAAIAAIKAMRDPTEAMFRAVDCAAPFEGSFARKMRADNWYAMVDAALEEGVT